MDKLTAGRVHMKEVMINIKNRLGMIKKKKKNSKVEEND